MLKALTIQYIISLLVIILIMIGGVVIYYIYYNKQINKRILDHVKGHALISPFHMALIIVVIGLLVSGVYTYHYNDHYHRAYQKLIINGKGTFEEKTISEKRLKNYHKHTVKTKYETFVYYTKDFTNTSLNDVQAYLIFKPIKRTAIMRLQCYVKEFQFDRSTLPFVNTEGTDTTICFTTALKGTTLHIVLDQYYWSQNVFMTYQNEYGNLDLPLNSKKLDQKAFGKDHLTITVKV